MSKLAHSNDETMAQIEANARADDRDEFTGHGERCRGGAADCTCSPDYLASMADVAEALEESIAKNCPGWHPADSPVEIVVVLVNQRDDALAERDEARAVLIGIEDDYMTSDAHHPGHVLIPTAMFERLRAANDKFNR